MSVGEFSEKIAGMTDCERIERTSRTCLTSQVLCDRQAMRRASILATVVTLFLLLYARVLAPLAAFVHSLVAERDGVFDKRAKSHVTRPSAPSTASASPA